MGFTLNSLAALACKSWQPVLEGVHPELAQGKAFLLLLALNAFHTQRMLLVCITCTVTTGITRCRNIAGCSYFKPQCHLTTRPALDLHTILHINGVQEHDMTCLLNYSPKEQPELQWLASEAAVQHTWAQESHASLFSSQTGLLKSLQLADSLQQTLWAMSLVRSRTFSESVCILRVFLCWYENTIVVQVQRQKMPLKR